MEKHNKNNIHTEFDTIIKDHLKTSFEEDNIAVSEELIAKTLSAINNQTVKANNTIKDYNTIKDNYTLKDNITIDINNTADTYHGILSQKDQKRKLKLSVKRVAGAAAAILVLFVGVQVLQSNMGVKSKNMDGEEANTSYSMKIASDKASDEAYDTSIGNSDSSNEDSATGRIENSIISSEQSKILAKADNSSVFSERYFITSDQIESISITNNTSSDAVTTDKNSDAAEIIAILDENPIVDTEEDQSEDWYYQIELKIKGGKLYTIFLGNGFITITDGDSNKVWYTTENSDNMLKKIDELYNKLLSYKN